MLARKIRRLCQLLLWVVFFILALENINFMEDKNVIIIIPAYYEEKNLKDVIDDIKRNVPACDILIVNDGSLDRTEEVAKTNGVAYVGHPYNLGIGASRLYVRQQARV